MSASQDERAAGAAAGQPVFDTSVANPARIWNYWLGGKDHFEADREAAEKVIEVLPTMPLLARLARRQLTDTVRLLAGRYGIRQFLDIGTGLPEMTRRYNERSSASLTLRTRDQVARFFDGLELVGPGLVPLSQWWPADEVDPGAASGVIGYCGIGRKNGGGT